MKKSLLSFIMICCLLMTVIVPMASANELVYTFAANTAKVYGSDGAEKTIAANAEYVELTSMESMTIDLPENIQPGTYLVEIEYSTNLHQHNAVYLDAIVNNIVTNRKMLPDTGGTGSDANALNTYKNFSLYEVFIPDNVTQITFKNSSLKYLSSATFMPTVRVKRFIFSYVDSAKIFDNEITSSMVHNVLNTTEESGFHDEGSGTIVGVSGFLQYRNDNATQVILHANDWCAYDISNFKAGTYKMYLKVGTTGDRTVNVKLGENVAINSASVVSTGNYGIESNNTLGYIYIKDSDTTMYIVANSSIYTSEFTLEYIGEGNTTVSSKEISGRFDKTGGTAGNENAYSTFGGNAIYAEYDISEMSGKYKVSCYVSYYDRYQTNANYPSVSAPSGVGEASTFTVAVNGVSQFTTTSYVHEQATTDMAWHDFGTIILEGASPQTLRLTYNTDSSINVIARIQTVKLEKIVEGKSTVTMSFSNLNNDSINEFGTNSFIKANVDIQNNTSNVLGVVLVTAIYKHTELIDSDSVYIDVAAYGKSSKVFENINIENATEVKLFAWTAYETDGKVQITMLPLCASKSLPKTAVE